MPNMSEPPSKIARLDSASCALHQTEKEENSAEFFLILCHDVFLEVIRWGDRRQLVKLEQVGQRFHRNVERWFLKTPFLRLGLLIGPSQSGHGLEAKISKDMGDSEYSDIPNISMTDLAALPSFLRFHGIELVTSWDDADAQNDWDKQTIVAKCQFIEDQLKSIDPELLNDTELCFIGVVDENNSSRFASDSELLKYFTDRILSICDRPWGRRIEIMICHYSDYGAAKCVLTSLLQISQISCASDVQIKIDINKLDIIDEQAKLPVEEISNWLHRKSDSHQERSLTIHLFKAENVMEMFNQLKKEFEAAKSPMQQPYTFTLESILDIDGADEVEEQTLINETTKEQFSVEKEEDEGFAGIFDIIIKRCMKTKKKD